MKFLVFIFGVFILIQHSFSYINEFTVTIDPGKLDCFFTFVRKDVYFEVDYQVLDGQQGELDIDFHLLSPIGRRIVMDMKKSDNNHRTKAFENGDYKLCFDNSFSIVSAKTIFFEISTDDDEDDSAQIKLQNNAWGNVDKNFYAGLRPEEIYDIHVQDIKDSVDKVKGRLVQVQHYQDQLRVFEARDRNVAENNYERVNYFSLIHMVSLVLTGCIQVIMVRSLFDERSTFQRLLRQRKL